MTRLRIVILLGMTTWLCRAVVAAPAPARGSATAATAADAAATGVDRPTSATTEAEEGKAIRAATCRDLAAERFEALDARADEMRNKRITFSTGNWQLMDFYGGLELYPSVFKADDPDYALPLLNRWTQLRPNSVAARLFLANLHLRYAWKARGGGPADTVTEEGLKGFEEHLKKAEEYLRQAKVLNAKDPEIFATELTVGMGLGYPAEDMDAIVQRGLAIQPYYPPILRGRANSLLPRWYGRPGDVEKFAASFLEGRDKATGRMQYARVFIYVWEYTYENPFAGHNFDWSLVKEGIVLFIEKAREPYPYKNRLCFHACQAADRSLAADLFAQIGDYSETMKSIWTNKTIFTAWKLWATGKGPYPDMRVAVPVAFSRWNLDLLKEALDAGADINTQDNDGFTLLHIAIRHKRLDFARYLIQRGADVSKPSTTRNYHPIQSAAGRNEAEIIQLLLDRGASPNEVGNRMWYPLHLAAYYGHTESVRVLLKHKDININAKGVKYSDGIDESTPVYIAAAMGHTEIVKLLLDAGADTTIRDKQGRTPYEAALKREHPEAAALLKGK